MHPLIMLSLFFFNDTATTEIYTLSLHDALPISPGARREGPGAAGGARRAGRPQAAGARAEDAPRRGGPLLRARRAGPLRPPHRQGRRDDVAPGPEPVRGPRYLARRARDRARREPRSQGEDRASPPGGGGLRHEERDTAHHPQAAQGARAVRAGGGLRRAGGQGPDRGRVHRPPDARAALVGGFAPGGGSEGGGGRPG